MKVKYIKRLNNQKFDSLINVKIYLIFYISLLKLADAKTLL